MVDRLRKAKPNGLAYLHIFESNQEKWLSREFSLRGTIGTYFQLKNTKISHSLRIILKKKKKNQRNTNHGKFF